jgi:hypothetical protein
MLAAAVGLVAVLLLAFTAQDSFEVMLLPRRVVRQVRFVSLYYRLAWSAWSTLTGRLRREAAVIRVDGRAGSPPSHLSYPMLA